MWEQKFNTLLEVASFEVIKQHEKTIGSPPTGLYFNKLMLLSYSKLRKGYGIDIKLPHCWYRYGDEVVRYLMPNDVRWNHETPLYTTVSWPGWEPQYDDESINIVKDVVREFTGKYKDLTKEQLVDDVYSLAPFDFQRNFRQLRLNIERIMSSNVQVSNFKRAVLFPSLEKTIKSFPGKDFPQDVVERVQNYNLLMHCYLEHSSFSYDIAKEMTEDIWFYFCYYLRIHRNCYENVPRNVVEYWENQLDEQKDKFDRIFSEILIDLDNHGDLGFEGKLKDILEQRRDEKEEELQFLEEFLKD